MFDSTIERYIDDLPEEFQEGARQCKDLKELSAFIAENDIELPEEALEMVAGGYFNICGSNKPEPAPIMIEKRFTTNDDSFK